MKAGSVCACSISSPHRLVLLFLMYWFAIEVAVQYLDVAEAYMYIDPVIIFVAGLLFLIDKIYGKSQRGLLYLYMALTVVIIINLLLPVSPVFDGIVRFIFFIAGIVFYIGIIESISWTNETNMEPHFKRVLWLSILIFSVRLGMWEVMGSLWNQNWSSLLLLSLTYIVCIDKNRLPRHIEIFILLALLYLFIVADSRGVGLVVIALIIIRTIPEWLRSVARKFLGVRIFGIYIFTIMLFLVSSGVVIVTNNLLDDSGFVYIDKLEEFGIRGSMSGREVGLALFNNEIIRRGSYYQQLAFGDMWGIGGVHTADHGISNEYYDTSYVYNAFLQYWMIYGIIFALIFWNFIVHKVFSAKRFSSNNVLILDRLAIISITGAVYMVGSSYQLALTFYVMLLVFIGANFPSKPHPQ